MIPARTGERTPAGPPAGDWLFTDPGSPFGRRVCRLGLASRGEGELTTVDVHHALGLGNNFLHWAGTEDALSRTIAGLGAERERILVGAHLSARGRDDAARELEALLGALGSDYVDVLTFYYVEEPSEWDEIQAPGGALAYCRDAQRQGLVRHLGLTSHQRPLAAEIARTGSLDLLMIRYNAAHRGAEREIFPVTGPLGMPVITYTSLRWGALLGRTPDDPPGFVAPRAPEWYRFVLGRPEVSVALMAPRDRAELDDDLSVLAADGPLPAVEYDRLAEHGRRVRRHAGGFP
jgi:predicted aldo/keto reductase-like oxidoreductase